MIRMVLILAIVLVFLILSLPVLGILTLIWKKQPHDADICSLKIVQFMFRMIMRIAGVRVTVIGRERIPEDRAVLYVGNHRSYFDILVGYASVPSPTGFVAKKEMEKILLLAQWMRRVNCLFLDRVNMKEGLKTILTGIDKVKNGISIWIFPEGTRNPGEDILELMEFKEGSLKIAEKSGCPVVPVAISGTAEILEKHFPSIRRSHVTIEFGEPFIVKELAPDHRKHAGAYTRDRIIQMLAANREVHSAAAAGK